MTIKEIGERFCIPAEKLRQYEAEGLITGTGLGDGTTDFSEAEVRDLGMICIFTKAGFTCEEIRQYLALDGQKTGGTPGADAQEEERRAVGKDPLRAEAAR